MHRAPLSSSIALSRARSASTSPATPSSTSGTASTTSTPETTLCAKYITNAPEIASSVAIHDSSALPREPGDADCSNSKPVDSTSVSILEETCDSCACTVSQTDDPFVISLSSNAVACVLHAAATELLYRLQNKPNRTSDTVGEAVDCTTDEHPKRSNTLCPLEVRCLLDTATGAIVRLRIFDKISAPNSFRSDSLPLPVPVADSSRNHCT